MSLAIKFNHPNFADADLNESIEAILSTTRLLTMATVSPDGTAHANTAYFAYDDSARLFLITDPATVHAKNLRRIPSVAATVFDSHQEFWTPLRGLQIFGTCIETPMLELPHALLCFTSRFPVFAELVKHPADFAAKAVSVKLHTLAVSRIKLFDEPHFGEEVFIDLSLS